MAGVEEEVVALGGSGGVRACLVWGGGGGLVRTAGVLLGDVITGKVQGRGASIYRSLVTPRGSSIGIQVEAGQLRGCARAHCARGRLGNWVSENRGVIGYREWGGES